MKNNLQQRSFVEKLKNYEKGKQSLAAYICEEYLNEDGVAVIDLNLKGIEELYQPLSLGKQRDLNPDIYAFLDEKVYPVPAEIPVKIRIFGIEEEADKRNIERMLREHYNLRLHDNKLDLNINAIRSGVLFISGVVLLSLYFCLSSFAVGPLWYEILSIVATFIIWEAADFFILERRNLKIAYHDTAQMVLAALEFHSATEIEPTDR